MMSLISPDVWTRRRLFQVARAHLFSLTPSCVRSEEMPVFVKLPSSKYVILMLLPIDKVATVKEKIEGKLRFLCSRQALYFSGKLLDDRETLATYNITKNSTLHLKLWANPSIEIRVLPTNRLIFVGVQKGLKATIRDLKDAIRHKEGIVCEDLYLEDDFNSDQVGDDVTLEACGVPKQTLVWVQRGIPVGRSSPSCSRRTVRPVTREWVATAFEDALPTRRTLPLPGDLEPVEEVRKDPEQQKFDQQREMSDIEITIATMLQTHQDCERKLSRMLHEKNKLQMDLRELQSKYPKLLSDVLEERNKLQRDLKELQREFPRQLSLVLDEKNKLQRHLQDLQKELVQMSVVLNENSELQRDAIVLRKELEMFKIELGQERERSLCMICFDKPRDTLIFSCLHLHFCSSCLEKHQERTNRCPTCRSFISGKLICNVSIS